LCVLKTLEWNEGHATIRGNVRLINYKNESTPYNLIVKDTTNAQAEDVYINYNNSEFYTDKIETQPDVTIVFQNLLKGDYTIFIYSENVKNDSTYDVVKSVKVEITDIEQEKKLEEIIIEKI
ncbi:MAG: hypothetical protein PF541_00970, partial [Prolixibacteraceae bacterium]|nr:hypothetical protein [Prolixibacteraceae bacterium]